MGIIDCGQVDGCRGNCSRIVHVETARCAHAWQHQKTIAVLDKMKDAIAARNPMAARLIG